MMMVQAAWAQERCISAYPVASKIVLQDSLLIDPQSIVLMPNLAFDYDQGRKEISLRVPVDASIEVCYRVLPIQVGKVYRHLSPDVYDSTASFPVFQREVYTAQKEELFETPKIYKTGSLTRGVSFGNAQNVNVNSSFNFQMDGELTENLNIRADITDQNVPYQPEGNTQQLREFDNVTFEIYNDNLSITAGDVLLQNRETYFLRYNKNVLGGRLDYQYDLQEENKGRTTVAISAAKGQFVDITLEAEEGVQGPYQLRGPQGQQFLVVMANSEKVYVDGQLLARGFNNDYVIDYNLGEVTFTPNVPITQFSRIRVTFEYSDQNYSRSIMMARQELSLGQFGFSFDFYRERDDINRPLAFELSDEDKTLMSTAGDDQIPVPIGSELQVPFATDRVLYARIDTVDQEGNFASVFRFSRDSTEALFQVSFTDVGLGNGDYELVQNDVNGRVYQWVVPQMGQSMGSYAPVRFVPAPNMRQMVALGGHVQLGDHMRAYTELAFSNEDLNLYSSIGNEDNTDLATIVGIKIDQKPVWKAYTMSSQVSYEYDGKDFRPIDRFRPIEYDRNWSYSASQDTSRTSDNIFTTAVALQKDRYNAIEARVTARRKESMINGLQQQYGAKQSLGALKLSGDWFGLDNESELRKSTWQRWSGEAYYDQWFAVPGVRISADENEVRATRNDSLVSTAMNYQAQQFYLRSNDSLKVNFRLEHTIRVDRSIREGELLPFTQSHTSNLQLSSPQQGGQVVQLTAMYRTVDYQAEFSEFEDENLVLGRMNWRSTYFNKHLQTDMMYTTSSSKEILREFVYVQVAAGEGTHTWRDLNEDGIQDISEFFIAINFDEKNYIRVFIPTTESVDAFNTLFTYSLNATMPREWRSQGGIRAFLSQWSLRANVNINKKNTDDDFNSRFNPFALGIEDENLIFSRDGIRSTMFYNRTGRGFGGDLTYLYNRSKQAISRGIDSRSNQEYSTNLRYHIGREVTLMSGYTHQLKRNASQYQQDQDFRISVHKVAPGVVWQPTNNLRFSTTYGVTRKVNLASEQAQNSQLDELSLETRWAKGVTNSITANFTYTNITFEGEENTAAAYELLNALRPGINTAWRINYSQKLFSGLQLTLGYEGRKSSGADLIHMGRMQVTALF